jgi:hypothetical protein
MSIRRANNCNNCENLKANGYCSVHEVEVSSNYVCDNFEMKAQFKNEEDCTSCARFKSENCANPEKAAPGMMCKHWAPQNAA